MAIRNVILGGTDYTDTSILYAVELNDTNNAIISQNSATNPTPPPIGSVVGWAKTMTSVPQTLPAGWVECDGSTISDTDSPLNGVTIPNLLGPAVNTKRFLRGSTTSGTTGGADSTSHNHTQGKDDGSPNSSSKGIIVAQTVSSLPSYYEVVWIIRIK